MSYGKLKDGRWYVQYYVTDEKGKKNQKREYFGRGTSAKASAKARNQEIKAEKSEVLIKATGITFPELSVEYQKAKFKETGGISINEQKNIHYKLERFILPFFKNKKVLRIDDFVMDDYRNKRLEMWADKKKTRTVKATTIRREMSIIKAIINWGVNHKPQLVPYNPIAAYELPKRDDEVILPPKENDIIRIIKAAPDHLRRAILLNLSTGARAGETELLNIKWEYQDLESNIVVIFSAKSEKPSYRRIPVSDEMVELLNDWKLEDLALLKRVTKRREKEAARIGLCDYTNKAAELTVDDVTGPIIHFRGRPIKRYKRAWKETLERAKIKRRLRPYDLRHYFATTLIENGGAGIKTVSDLMGNTPETAARYPLFFIGRDSRI
jgi:integrase